VSAWIEVAVSAASPAELAIADALVSAHALRGTAIEGQPPVLRAWFSADERAGAERLRRALSAALPDATVSVDDVADAAWADAWREHFRPQRVGDVLIVPPWERPQGAHEARALVEIDPGQAFGTGLHPTTRACLFHLQELDLAGHSVTDVGTGSGILAIAAALLGAASVYACDVDPVAVRAARENVERNGVSERVTVDFCRADLVEVEAADVVVANLTADLILELARALSGRLRPSGTLVLAGIVTSRERAVRDALSALALEISARRTDGEWVSLRARAR